jgi:hypothetical protein
MIKPLDEIRVSNDAIELVQTLRVKHPHVQWAIQACEISTGGQWRVVVLVLSDGVPMRFQDWWASNTRPMQICARVNEILSQF